MVRLCRVCADDGGHLYTTAAGPPEGCHGMDVDEELTKKCSVEIMINTPERRDLSLCGLQEEDAVM